MHQGSHPAHPLEQSRPIAPAKYKKKKPRRFLFEALGCAGRMCAVASSGPPPPRGITNSAAGPNRGLKSCQRKRLGTFVPSQWLTKRVGYANRFTKTPERGDGQ